MTMGMTCFLLFKDTCTLLLEDRVERNVAALGEEYVQGGVEYYEKILKRNIALRTLLGSQGEKRFTACGNDNTLFRTRTLPNTMRYDNMKKALQKVENKGVKAKITDVNGDLDTKD